MKKYLLITFFVLSSNMSSDAGAPFRGAAIGLIGGTIAYICDSLFCTIQNQYIKLTQPAEELIQVHGSTVNGALIIKKDLKLKKPFDFTKLIITTTVIGFLAGSSS